MNVRVIPNPDAFRRLRTMNEALRISDGDMKGPVLVRCGLVHRTQEKRIFATQGAAGAAGRWPALSRAYAARKRRDGYGRKILVRTGDMKARLTMRTNPSYIQRAERVGTGWVLMFGAFSRLAGYHRRGSGSLPVREMLNKTVEQIAEFQKTILDWYIKARVPQATRHLRGGR